MRNAYGSERSAIDAGGLNPSLPSLPSPSPSSPTAQQREQGHPRLRVRGLFLVSGFAFGVLVGAVFFGGPFPAALVGMAGGMLAELLYSRN